jgi:hypothetical protein
MIVPMIAAVAAVIELKMLETLNWMAADVVRRLAAVFGAGLAWRILLMRARNGCPTSADAPGLEKGV